MEELSKIATHYGIIHNGSLLQELTREELLQRCSERMEISLDEPKRALPILDRMGFTNYQVMDKNTIQIYERLDESAQVNMKLSKAGILVRGIGITSEELEQYCTLQEVCRMFNMIRMELFRMFKTKSLYVIWAAMAACLFFANSLSAEEIQTYSIEEKQEMYEAGDE